MGNPKAFLNIGRQEAGYRPIHDRIHDFGEVEQTLNSHQRREQASRIGPVRWAIRHLNGMMHCIKENGNKPIVCSRRQTLSRNLRGVSVRHSVKRHVCSISSIMNPPPTVRMSVPSSREPSGRDLSNRVSLRETAKRWLS